MRIKAPAQIQEYKENADKCRILRKISGKTDRKSTVSLLLLEIRGIFVYNIVSYNYKYVPEAL